MKETGINDDPDEQAPDSKGKKDKSIELLRQIRDNTSSTNNWVANLGCNDCKCAPKLFLILPAKLLKRVGD